MSIPGYDAWKLMTPEEDYESRGGKLCPFCGAYSPRQCELDEDTGGVCAWEESQPDPDALMEARRDDKRMAADQRDDGDF
ncbi:hypothetical protein [Mesorhizobium sp. M1B.F.Ca.ET.045.04.1.1]|uniref:hypothetical protein n=1 Tax=Mesorhizobium sp. M1B.F.Ca.ET.045.04.1.1 TaxID=2493673 RepID=UPI000F75E9D5|nr:hypothetical protein [Mesorhizobium sp. M1B.F.Ca.ET.045.04.1.1]AZO29294.1 hypothetical protein EJ071_19195 [Mesorhizobium sp. M1B.F.Ca.ET.045.04.1.1]